MTIRVLVVDDQAMVRAGFRMLLADKEDIEVVAEAGNGLEAVDKAIRFDPTVILMDIRMPELDGLQATRRILAADNRARILILTTFDLDEYVYQALKAGASGFVLKDDPPDQLTAAIRTVAAGGERVWRRTARRLRATSDASVLTAAASSSRSTNSGPAGRSPAPMSRVQVPPVASTEVSGFDTGPDDRA